MYLQGATKGGHAMSRSRYTIVISMHHSEGVSTCPIQVRPPKCRANWNPFLEPYPTHNPQIDGEWCIQFLSLSLSLHLVDGLPGFVDRQASSTASFDSDAVPRGLSPLLFFCPFPYSVSCFCTYHRKQKRPVTSLLVEIVNRIIVMNGNSSSGSSSSIEGALSPLSS